MEGTSNMLEKYLQQVFLNNGPQTRKIATGIGATLLTAFAIKQIYKVYRIRCNNKKRERKRAKKEASIQEIREKCKYVKPEEVERITRLSLTELRNAIQSRKLKPSEVLIAYQAKSLEAQDRTNCITEYITEAEAWAEEADQSDGEGKLLHGIPISLKDDVPLMGYDCTLGVIDLCEQPVEKTCTIVQLLQKHGAIPFCKTNIPQFEMAFECSNPIFGETCNPHDTERVSGGSSGGEAALIAIGGSILGFGSDIGGSIRNPSDLTGLCGFKPTASRQSYYGHELVAGKPDLTLENVLQSAWGPLSRDMEGVIVASKILLDGKETNKIDPLMVPLPFDEEVFNSTRPLRIGYYLDNGLLTTVPAVKRAVRQAKDYLESKGHTLLEWLPPDFEAISDLLDEAIWANGGEEYFEVLAYETEDDCVKYPFRGRLLPQWLRPLYAKLLAFKDPFCAKMVSQKYQRKTDSYWETSAKFRQVRRKVTEEWRTMSLDALICPAGAFPAPPRKSSDLLYFAGPYMMIYNVLNFPAGVVRMTSVTEEDNDLMKHYPDHDMYHRRVKEAMKGSVGLPVGVQVVTPWYEDEMCLRVMKEAEGAADFHVIDKQAISKTLVIKN